MYPQIRNYQIDYFFGWRYLFSPNFRKKIRQELRTNPLYRVFCILGGFIGMIYTGALIVFALMASWYLITPLLS